jgi:hypothetical protein
LSWFPHLIVVGGRGCNALSWYGEWGGRS